MFGGDFHSRGGGGWYWANMAWSTYRPTNAKQYAAFQKGDIKIILNDHITKYWFSKIHCNMVWDGLYKESFTQKMLMIMSRRLRAQLIRLSPAQRTIPMFMSKGEKQSIIRFMGVFFHHAKLLGNFHLFNWILSIFGFEKNNTDHDSDRKLLIFFFIEYKRNSTLNVMQVGQLVNRFL